MKTGTVRIISLAAALLLIITALSGCGRSGEKETGGDTSAVKLGASPYGNMIVRNGITMYLDKNGVYSTAILPQGDTFVNTEYTAYTFSGGDPVRCQRWIGFKADGMNFEEGAMLRAKVISACDDREDYDKYSEMIDDSIRKSNSYKSTEIFSVTVENPDGTDAAVFDPEINWLIEVSERYSYKAVCISEGADEVLETSVIPLDIQGAGEVRFLRITAKHYCRAIALIAEE